MAKTLVWTIQFTGNNPEGDYVSGDVVKIFYDPAADPGAGTPITAGLTVEKNGIQILAGANISSATKSYKITSPGNAFICNGTTGITFSPLSSVFPYGFTVSFPDNPSCAIIPETCDLIVVGVPVIVPASSQTTSDGEITVEAQSSQPIQYKLDSDFVYGDGTAQTHGHFWSYPGVHRIYLRDSSNCSTSVSAEVGISTEYNPVYHLEYDDFRGNLTKIEILKRAFDGVSTLVVGGGNPIQLRLRGEAENDKFTPMLPTEATVQLLNETDGQFSDLYTNFQKEYRIAYYKDLGDTLLPFVPEVMDDISTWPDNGSGMDTPIYPWILPDRLSIHLTGTGRSKKKNTAYGFVAGETYSFDYIFDVTVSWFVPNAKIIIQISNGTSLPPSGPQSYPDLGVNLELEVTETGTISGTYTFVAPVGAGRIIIFCTQVITDVFYEIISFENVTASHGGAPEGYKLKWIGNLLPQQYQSVIKLKSYTQVVAKDGLTDLKNIDFIQDDGQPFFGRVKAITMIAACLKKTLLELPIRCSCNLYALDMDSGDTDDPLDQAYVDPDAYYLVGDPTFEFVLTEILRPFRARVIQWNGRWNIIRPEECIDAFKYRDFDPNGVFITNGEYDPVKDVKVPSQDDCFKWVAFPNRELRPGYGDIRVIYHLGLKKNILRNGDFRLKSTFNSFTGRYDYLIDKFGFQLIAPYPISEDAEILQAPNVAYVMKSDEAVTTGQAALLSDTYPLAMGSNNTLKITARYKLPQPFRYGLGVDGSGNLQTFIKPYQMRYQKVRMLIRYRDLYLLSDGTWSIFYNECVFYADKWGEYIESEIIAVQPDSSFIVEDDFSVQIFQSWSNHTEFQTLADLKAKVTGIGDSRGSYDASSHLYPATGGSGGGGAIEAGNKWTISVAGVLNGLPALVGYWIIALVDAPGQTNANWFVSNSTIQALPTGTKTELLEAGGFLIDYYELEENSDPDDDFGIVRPNDYSLTNQVQWILKQRADLNQNRFVSFFLDHLSVEVLVDGRSPIDGIIRTRDGEPHNNTVLPEDLFHGSLSNIMQSAMVLGVEVAARPLDIFQQTGGFPKSFFPRISKFVITQNILHGKLVYAGFLSDAAGEGYDLWSRASQDESLTLHDIFLRTTTDQYNRSFSKISGSLVGDEYLGLIDVIRYEDTLYLPMAVTINDKDNRYEGEFLELMDTTTTADDSAFTIGFSKGHKA